MRLHVEIPAVVAGEFGEMGSTAQELIDGLWPIVVALVIGFVVVKLFKRSMNSDNW